MGVHPKLHARPARAAPAPRPRAPSTPPPRPSAAAPRPRRRSSVPRARRLDAPAGRLADDLRHDRQRAMLDPFRGDGERRARLQIPATRAAQPPANAADGTAKSTSSAPRTTSASDRSSRERRRQRESGQKAHVLMACRRWTPRHRARAPTTARGARCGPGGPPAPFPMRLPRRRRTRVIERRRLPLSECCRRAVRIPRPGCAPGLGSSPRRSRSMLARCVHQTNAAVTSDIQKTGVRPANR